MTLQEAFKTCLGKYATFEGRADRSEYWWFVLAQVLIVMGASILSEKLSGLAALALLLPMLAVTARRLHDIGRSGWWQLVYFVPLVGWLVLLYWTVQPSRANA